jgi:hypothetical protein
MLGWFLADILVSLASIDEEFSLPDHSRRISFFKNEPNYSTGQSFPVFVKVFYGAK